MTIPFSSIIEGDRARNKKKYGNIEDLAESLKSLGTIQPIVLSKRWAKGSKREDNDLDMSDEDAIRMGWLVFDLVAGGRRYRAMQHLNVKELYHGSTLDPQKLGFVFADEVPEHVRKEAELDENLHRLDMDWVDNCLLIADVHRTKKDIDPKWGVRSTAALLGEGYGKSHVNNAIRVAKLLRAGDDQILKCKSLMEALAVLIQRKEDEALAALQKRAMASITPQNIVISSKPTGTSSFLDTLSKVLGPSDPVTKAVAATQQTGPTPATQPPVEIPLSRLFSLGDFRSVPWPKVDHIVTDIPYGIDMDNLDDKQIASVKDTHDVEQNVEQMEPFLRMAFDAVKPGGFLVFCFDLDHWNYIQKTAKAVGWRVQDWPFIACKTSACKNNAPAYNTTKNYEAIAYMRRDEKTVLRKPIPTSWKPYDFSIERSLYSNPFAKPFELWKDIYDAIAFPGQHVLDPCCGQMSACRAAVNCGLIPHGIELSEKHYNAGLELMRKAFALVHKSNCTFT